MILTKKIRWFNIQLFQLLFSHYFILLREFILLSITEDNTDNSDKNLYRFITFLNSWNSVDGEACVLLLQGKERLAEEILQNSTFASHHRAAEPDYAPMIDATQTRVYHLGNFYSI